MARSDEQLMTATRRGEAEAFGEFFARHRALVLAYLVRRTGTEEAADLLAETFAGALIAVHAGRAPRGATAAPWLLTIARHKLYDAHRRGVVEDSARRRLALERLEPDVEEIEAVALDLDAALAVAPGGPARRPARPRPRRTPLRRDRPRAAHDRNRRAPARLPRAAAPAHRPGEHAMSYLDALQEQFVGASRALSARKRRRWRRGGLAAGLVVLIGAPAVAAVAVWNPPLGEGAHAIRQRAARERARAARRAAARADRGRPRRRVADRAEVHRRPAARHPHRQRAAAVRQRSRDRPDPGRALRPGEAPAARRHAARHRQAPQPAADRGPAVPLPARLRRRGRRLLLGGRRARPAAPGCNSGTTRSSSCPTASRPSASSTTRRRRSTRRSRTTSRITTRPRAAIATTKTTFLDASGKAVTTILPPTGSGRTQLPAVTDPAAPGATHSGMRQARRDQRQGPRRPLRAAGPPGQEAADVHRRPQPPGLCRQAPRDRPQRRRGGSAPVRARHPPVDRRLPPRPVVRGRLQRLPARAQDVPQPRQLQLHRHG